MTEVAEVVPGEGGEVGVRTLADRSGVVAAAQRPPRREPAVTSPADARAEEMYHPETFGRGAGDRLVVE